MPYLELLGGNLWLFSTAQVNLWKWYRRSLPERMCPEKWKSNGASTDGAPICAPGKIGSPDLYGPHLQAIYMGIAFLLSCWGCHHRVLRKEIQEWNNIHIFPQGTPVHNYLNSSFGSWCQQMTQHLGGISERMSDLFDYILDCCLSFLFLNKSSHVI